MNDPRADLQFKIRKSIPLSEQMQFTITELSAGSIQVSAPLEPNVNIHGTGFAGSIYSIAVLAGWGLSTHIMDVQQMRGNLVVSKAEIKYRAPITETIECTCLASEAERENFLNDFNSSGKGKLTLTINVGDAPHAVLLGTFYAVAKG